MQSYAHLHSARINKRSLICAGLAACAMIAATSARAQGPTPAPTTVRIITYPIAGLAAMKIAEQQGFFKEEGISPEWVLIRTPADGVANLLGGKADIGFINVGGLAAAAAQKLPLKAVAPMYFSANDFGIYVKADSPIKNIADLNGKTVGLVQLKNNVHAMVMDSIERGGGNPGSVSFTLIPAANILAALRAGTVDAAQIVEPFIATGGDSIRPLIPDVFQFSGGKGITAYYITAREFASKNPALLQRFTRAVNKAQEFAKGHPDAVRKAASAVTEVPAELLSKMILPQFGSDLSLENAEQQVDLMVKYKLLSEKIDIRPYFE
jgi:NitT/TauT family transport system substrate-binding protein